MVPERPSELRFEVIGAGLRRRVRVMAVVALTIAAVGCECPEQTFPPDQFPRVSVESGVWGRVWLWGPEPTPRGDGCDEPREIVPASRTVLIFARATSGDATGARWSEQEGRVFGTYYDAILTSAVDSVSSDETGFFQLRLDPGEYTVLLREGDALFWPGGNREADEINPIEVPDQGVAALFIDIVSLRPL